MLSIYFVSRYLRIHLLGCIHVLFRHVSTKDPSDVLRQWYTLGGVQGAAELASFQLSRSPGHAWSGPYKGVTPYSSVM